MKASDFRYHLPEDRIAQHPVQPADNAKLMVISRSDASIHHAHVRDLPDFLDPADCLCVNNTRVFPARAFATKETGGVVELLFLQPEADGQTWKALMKASRRPKPDARLTFRDAPDASVVVLESLDHGACRVRYEGPRPLFDLLEDHGHVPLPPYIHREHSSGADADQEAVDRSRYQTPFAKHAGAVAAPTAGLHFTPDLLSRIRAKGCQFAEVTLHVGLGTFQPVKVEDLSEHIMHAERFEVDAAAAEALRATRERGGRIVSIGTTSCRSLESMGSLHQGSIQPCSGDTELFILPPYDFTVVDALFTNFHLPESTLLMMVSAFAGKELVDTAYRTAIEESYRFYSYGDAMLLL